MPAKGSGVDLTGQRFGRWVVVGFNHYQGKIRYWECLCECGTQKSVVHGSLIRSLSHSCGCFNRERLSELKTTHGNTVGGATPEYKAWNRMKRRCYNPNEIGYEHWGGRGITVCDEWREDFAAFLRDMGPMPPKHSVERRNNELGYFKTNCYWATHTQQMNNRSNTRYATYRGKRMPIQDAIRLAGVSKQMVYHRVYKGVPEDRWFDPSTAPRRRS